MYIVSAKFQNLFVAPMPSNKIKVAPGQKMLGTTGLKDLQKIQYDTQVVK